MKDIKQVPDSCYLGVKEIGEYIKNSREFLKYADKGGCPVARGLISKSDKILSYDIFSFLGTTRND